MQVNHRRRVTVRSCPAVPHWSDIPDPPHDSLRWMVSLLCETLRLMLLTVCSLSSKDSELRLLHEKFGTFILSPLLSLDHNWPVTRLCDMIADESWELFEENHLPSLLTQVQGPKQRGSIILLNVAIPIITRARLKNSSFNKLTVTFWFYRR
jgi:hypothetical protein